jgi:type IV pilus assembly protein PilQ
VALAAVVACSHSPVTKVVTAPDIQLKDILLNDSRHGKKIVLKFEPEVADFDVKDYPERRSTELRWKAAARVTFTKDMTFNETVTGMSKLNLAVDGKAGNGVLEFFHEALGNYSVNRVGNDLVLTLKAEPVESRKPASVKPVHEERRISINVKDAPLAKLLRTLASESRRNLVLDSAVDGKVSVTLADLPYEKAVDTILKPTSYRAEHQGNVTVIRTEKADSTFRSFQLHHIDANKALDNVKKMTSSDAKVTVDANTNTVFVTDKNEMLVNIEKMLTVLDREPRQVEVEAAILELEKQNALSVGTDYPNPNSFGAASSASASTASAAPLLYNNLNSYTQNISPLQETDPNAKALFVGLSWRNIKAIISVLATNSKLHYLARPRVLALSDQQASIVLGSQLGYSTLQVSQTGTVENVKFLTVGTQLTIKPHITETNDILMYIKPEVSDGKIDDKTRLPSANTTTSESEVLARSGQTIVIAGLFKDREEKTVSKVPLLGDLPLLGFLFSGVQTTKTKSEVVILLSPRILDSQAEAASSREGNDIIDRFYREENFTKPVHPWGGYGG